MRTIAIAVLAWLIACTPAEADNESACNDAIATAFAGLRNAWIKAQTLDVNQPNAYHDNHRVDVKKDLLRLAVTGPSSPCTAAVVNDAVPVSSFGPGATCPASFAYNYYAGQPITSLDDLEFCLFDIAYGHAQKSWDGLDLFAGVNMYNIDKNEHRCVRGVYKSMVKAWRTGIGDVQRCAKAGTKPFACSLDASPTSTLGRALARIDAAAAKCKDASGVEGALSGESAHLCRRHVTNVADVAACARETAMCLACRDANAMYELGADCAAFASSRTCYGGEPEMGEGAAFVTNAGDDTVTRYAPGLAYAAGSLAASSLAVGANPTAVALHVGSNTLFTANRDDDTVTLIAASTGDYANGSALASTIAVGDEPVDLDVNPVEDLLYVVNRGSNSVMFFDAYDGTPAFGNLASSTFAVGASPSAVRYVPRHDGYDIPAKLIVANGGDDSITLLDPATGAYAFGTLAASTFATVTAPTSISPYPYHTVPVAIGSAVDEAVAYHSPSTGLPWFGTLAQSTLPVGMPVDAIAGRAGIAGVFDNLNLSGKNLLSTTDDALLSVSDYERRSEGPIATGAGPVAADVAPSDPSLYVVEQGLQRVARYTPGDSFALSTLDISPEGVGGGASFDRIAVNTLNDTVYVVTCGSGNRGIRYIDAATGQYKLGSQAASTFPLSNCSFNVAVSPTRNLVYLSIPSSTTSEVVYLDATTGAYVGSVSVDSGAGPLAVDEVDGIVYVANRRAGGVPHAITYLDADAPALLGADLAASSIDTPGVVNALAVDASTATLYAAEDDYFSSNGDVLYLDALAPGYKYGTLAASQMTVGSTAFAIAVNSDTNTLFVGAAAGMAYLDATTGAPVPGAATGGGIQFAVDEAAGVLYSGGPGVILLMHFDNTDGYLTGGYDLSHINTSGYDLAIHPGLGLLYAADGNPYSFEQRLYFWNARYMSLAFPDVSLTQTIATGPMPTDIAIAR